MEPALSYVDPSDPKAAAQILSGLFPDGWTSKEATVLLKVPPSPTPLTVKFFVPPAALARHVRLLAGTRLLAERTLPGPGAYEISAAPPLSPASLSLTVSVDQTFSAPPDTRALGIVVTGVGFLK
jgi:hypothetical protein